MLKLLLSIVAVCSFAFAEQNQVPNSQDIKNSEIKKFVNVSQKIAVIKQEVQQDLTKSGQDPTQDELQKANETFVSKAQEVIEKENFTAEKYNTFVALYQSDKDFQQRVMKLLK